MPSETPLTVDDFDAIAYRAAALDDPTPVVAELIAAVERGPVEDDETAAHAFILAAEITERAGDLPGALGYARRATEVPGEDGLARAGYAELLVKSGREKEGRELFDALRPELLQDPHAPAYVGEALDACGLGAVAEEWLSVAARTIVEENQFGPEDDSDDLGVLDLLFAVLTERHRIRESMEFPHDELDGLFHEMEDALDEDEPVESGQALLYWPEAELAQVLQRWPERADIYGLDWLDHRTNVERTLAAWSSTGVTRIALIPGSMAGLLAYAAEAGVDPGDREAQADYAADRADGGELTEWPPQRNGACWCASGAKYKKCCLPRSRA
ncbi:SEC-C metal-binding domain-containing protein [Actinoplanes sp. HUAS TT8]|uniref:SEC-C metal-binding domain-containing protein n=1 Tax=Actinoplanes sp. HUAS TT8 TaxID=3447453 RepID=UPI003F5241C7